MEATDGGARWRLSTEVMNEGYLNTQDDSLLNYLQCFTVRFVDPGW